MSDSKAKIVLLGVDGLIPELIERFCDEGVLPHIQTLRREGSATRLTPYISTWGDTNFVSMLTGQAPGTSWVGQRISPTGTRHLLELMAQQGRRAALVHFPESLKPAGPNDLCFAPFWSAGGPAPMELAEPALHTTVAETPGPAPTESLGWPPAGATLAHHQKHNRRPVTRDGAHFSACLRMHRADDIPITLTPTADGGLNIQLADAEATLAIGDWSAWLPIDGNDARVRFKLLALDTASSTLELLQSQVTAPATSASDAALARTLTERHGPFISTWTVTCSPDERAYETSFEEGAYQLEWLTDAALTLLNEHGFDLFATVFRLNDETHHTCLAQCDPESLFYDADNAETYLDTIRRAYRVLDEGVGRLLAGCDAQTHVVLASDHGDVPNQYLCDIHRRLAEFDLCTLDANGQPVPEKSQALLKNERGGLEIFVNLVGRDPAGIVDPADYQRVQARILKALNSWTHDTATGEQPVVALAASKRDARAIGYWGAHAGDVVFAYNQGFVWGTNVAGDTVAAVQSPGANHGPQIPTAHTAFASNEGLAIMRGPGITPGGTLASGNGLYRMDDVGATFADWLDLSNRAALEGRPLSTNG